MLGFFCEATAVLAGGDDGWIGLGTGYRRRRRLGSRDVRAGVGHLLLYAGGGGLQYLRRRNRGVRGFL